MKIIRNIFYLNLILTLMIFGQLSTPIQYYPENADTVFESDDPFLEWSEVENTEYYEIAIGWSKTFYSYTWWENPNLLSVIRWFTPGTYPWKVRAVNGSLKSEWSEEWNFTFVSDLTLSETMQPKVTSPANGIEITQSDPGSTLLACENIPSAASFEFEVSKDSLFRKTNSSFFDISNDNSSEIEALGLSTGKWFWRVRASNSSVTTDWSVVHWFIYYADVTNVQEEELYNEFKLSQNYPNPFNPTTTIEYSIPTTDFVNITVYDLLGNKISELVNEQKSAGNYKIKFGGNNLSSGIYIYVLRTTNFTDSKKLILLK
jgi:hypothetical protein